jgi:hypothetical protein
MPVFDLTTTEGRADLLTWRDQWIAKRVGVDLAQVVRSMADDAPAM